MASLETLLQPSKVFVFSGTLTADGLLSFSNPNGDGVDTPYLDLSGIDWERIVVDMDVSAASGTSPTLDLEAKTVNIASGTTPTTSLCDVKDGSGTAFAMTQATAATREIKALGRKNSDADGAGVANVGKYIAFFAETGGTSPSFTTKVVVYVGK